jgi:hypothetical protein
MSTEEKPTNHNKPWTRIDEDYLLNGLKDNESLVSIALSMKRTKGSIASRVKIIAYEMYMDGKSMNEILEITKLGEITLREYILKKEEAKETKKRNEENQKVTLHTINSEIICIKNEIQSMKSSVNELTDMIKAIYEFEI